MTTKTKNKTAATRAITSVLVANRGEIACRVFRTCRDMGIATVAVYSDPDADAPHVRQADSAVRLPGSTSAETYLRGELIIDAARAAGADAIHPGYGFLSENAEFAQSVIDAGLIWIGPPPSAITAMGSKVNAKELMDAAGVPVLGDLDPAKVTADDLPLLIKASAGGGGRGMRIVRDLADLDENVAAAKREAESAFGDPTVFCEPYVERGHHIEVQVMADNHGAVWAVGERECSIQRRHQKVIEEAPAPLVESLGGDLRERLYDAARKAVAAIGYSGAGTVEFLADGNGRFYFLETNTRLQVEHPVTEETTGLDLVEWQLRVAMGEPLTGDEPVAVGHSIEARLYAENPAAEWAPQSGTVHRFAVDERASAASRIRVDTGIADGSEISTFYDPMIAKVISWAPTRRRAAATLAAALAGATLHGPVTNRDMLVNTLRSEQFLSGDTDTAFIDEVGLDVLAAPLADEADARLAAIAAALADAEWNRAGAQALPAIPSGFRNIASGFQEKKFGAGDDEVTVRYRFERRAGAAVSARAPGYGVVLPDDEGVEVVAVGIASAPASPDGGRVVAGFATGPAFPHGGRVAAGVATGPVFPHGGRVPGSAATRCIETLVTLNANGVTRDLIVARYGDTVFVDSPGKSVTLGVVPRYIDPSTVQRPGSLLAPMPGSVIRVAVAEGDKVTAGQPLLWLEAMKMEHTIAAPSDGIVATLAVEVGRQLAVGDVLAIIEAESEESDES
ncbi:acyl-CoA carboxylase alpha chain [Gordonia araii NBRC 100433]|uniref:biotin carboxylase n=1 Tax=Gordonia araii NBRC 100433 TaxID=1073574 RepID=G7H3S8_9ACTN|nr:biotin carboxylase N-terminal domain-containing protein [Gordonia araii]NNG98675.1 acetyl/propionyl-CoA carboxylase subunit alpha [Gordonia araii NBRC 100433]GAB10503.1 acyl-CoA carboxylase alpha chain [Gordonia araii NBRC 100433]